MRTGATLAMQKKSIVLGLVVYLFSGLISTPWAKTLLTHLDLQFQPTVITVTLTCTGPIQHKHFTLSKPNRIVIDLAHTQLATTLPPIVQHPTLTKIRYGYRKPDTLRLVLDLTQAQQTTTQLHRSNTYQQLVLNLRPQQNTLNRPISLESAAISSRPKPIHATPIKAAYRKSSNIKIVIDPGHGGHDPGTINRVGVQEKTVALAIAQKLKQQLRSTTNFDVILTRYQDTFIPLRTRLSIARRHQADLFLSIHADAFIHPYSQGASVFTLSLRGASSEAARWLAARENNSELGGARLPTQDILLRSILINLSQKTTIAESQRAADYILQALGRISLLHRGIVEQAPFLVLKAPDVPSVLIETGFLSNPTEARRLRNPIYQQRIAEAISGGIQAYFRNKASKSL